MATRGFLIRFIDIGLIVLFGFLMISDIEASSRVELAGSEEAAEEAPEPEEDRAFVVVEITPGGTFVVGERVSTATAGDSVAGRSEPAGQREEGVGVMPATGEAAGPSALSGRRVRVADVEGLAEALRTLAEEHRGRGLETVVLIEPHPASAVQRTVDVLDVSDRLGLAKSLRMDIEIAPAADPR